MKPNTITSLLFILLCPLLVFAQNLPIDKSITIGKLKNGLSYYHKANQYPSNRIELRLIIKAGAFQDPDSLQGLAHLCEHLEVHATQHFKDGEIVNFLTKNAIDKGRAALTYNNETSYSLSVPLQQLDTAFLILQDWASGGLVQKEVLENEKTALLIERRGMNKFVEQVSNAIGYGSMYAQRNAMGKEKDILKCTVEDLRNFYRTWYRPDLMTVVIVGNISKDLAEKYIHQHFANLSTVNSPLQKEQYHIPNNKEPLVFFDNVNNWNHIRFYCKYNRNSYQTVPDLRNYLSSQLFNDLVNERVSNLELYGFIKQDILDIRNPFNADYSIVFGQAQQNLETYLTENERIVRFGFNKEEIETVKNLLEEHLEERWLENENSSTLADAFVNHVLGYAPYLNYDLKDVLIDSKWQYEFIKKSIAEISTEEINAVAKKWNPDSNLVVWISGTNFKKEDILAMLQKVKTKPLLPYVSKVDNRPLLPTIPQTTKISSRKENKKLACTELVLANGIKVILKSTHFGKAQINMSAIAKGGIESEAEMEILKSISDFGAGDFTSKELSKKLAGREITINTAINHSQRTITGYCSTKNLETMLKITHLKLLSPYKNATTYNNLVKNLIQNKKNARYNPKEVFYDSIERTLSNKPCFNENEFQKISLEQAYQLYQNSFSYANGFTYFLVGQFEIDSVIPLLQRYIGSIPSHSTPIVNKEKISQFPDKEMNIVFNNGTENKTKLNIRLKNNLSLNTEEEKERFNIVNRLFKNRLNQVMRMEKGKVYGVGMEIHDYYTEYFTECAATDKDELIQIFFAELEKIQKGEITSAELENAKQNIIQAIERDFNTNEGWIINLKSVYYDNTKSENVLSKIQLIQSTTIKDIQTLTQNCYRKDRCMKAVLLPKG